MDRKIEYKLAARYQIHHTFLLFFGRRFAGFDDRHSRENTRSSTSSSSHSRIPCEPPLSEEEALSLADRFADIIPEYTFAIAQIQGYLLMKKAEPRAAVDGAAQWAEEQIAEKQKLAELKEMKRKERMERKAALKVAVDEARKSEGVN